MKLYTVQVKMKTKHCLEKNATEGVSFVSTEQTSSYIVFPA